MQQRKFTVDPRHEELPAGDWPNVGFDLPQDSAVGGHYFSGTVAGIILSLGIAVVLIAMAMYVVLGAR